MQQRQNDKQYDRPTKDEVLQRLYAIGARQGQDDPLIKRMRHYAQPASDEEIFEMMEKALGSRSIKELLDEIR